MMFALRPLSDARAQDVDCLLDRAFCTNRQTRTAYRIRQGMPQIETLSLAAIANETLVGSLQCWPVAVGEAPLTLVGPVAVDPDWQRNGIGRALMTHLIEIAPNAPMVLIGDPEYYGRFFGFSAADTAGWDVPGPVERHRLLARNAAGLPGTGMLGPRSFATTGAHP